MAVDTIAGMGCEHRFYLLWSEDEKMMLPARITTMLMDIRASITTLQVEGNKSMHHQNSTKRCSRSCHERAVRARVAWKNLEHIMIMYTRT
jgi:hypothetical protein